MQLQNKISELKYGDKFVFQNEVGVWQKIDDKSAKCIFGGDDTVTYHPDANVFVFYESEKCEVASDSTSDNELDSIIDTQMDKIKQDLIARKSVISAVTVLEPKTGNQTVLGYKPNGVLYLVSSDYPIIQFYGSNFGKGGMYAIGNIYSTQAENNYIAYERETKKQSANTKYEQPKSFFEQLVNKLRRK